MQHKHEVFIVGKLYHARMSMDASTVQCVGDMLNVNWPDALVAWFQQSHGGVKALQRKENKTWLQQSDGTIARKTTVNTSRSIAAENKHPRIQRRSFNANSSNAARS
jgi:hypothetical protein